jgi:UPF0271 protein
MREANHRFMDLNADLGEGCHDDRLLMPLIQRANIACGGHAGDETSMRQSIQLAQNYNVGIGAHPSYPDRDNFGRTETGATPADIEKFCRRQLDAFVEIAKTCNASVNHVKPHGALYHRVMQDSEAANAFVRAVQNSIGHCAIMGLPDSMLQKETILSGLPFVVEMFADRRYEADGNLTPRLHPDALIENIEEAIAQVRSAQRDASVRTRTGEKIFLKADTVCVHGDGEHALALASALHQLLFP